ncbi:protein qutG [Neurospora tetrasperma FGSC 2508]|uniref:Inositol-1-monophosphatase n=1 Tax=Neurospora tetrasperma (strain FGSC 2508 / ATCC MYA-4615 / P0657) TaxID=510951 RepID=F8MTZ6_NEUT8|nr:protein qutG [Neurospora tetrasperma FGSC 2508]EGO55478.1 protein qutG [Neurospora tetrasperma FGSC 2508]EGZ69293.1 protein qutG [Neurospora tetrasperma FGSC 2509]
MTTRTTTAAELDEIYTFAVQLGKDAGNLLMEAARLRFSNNNANHDKESTSQEFTEKDSAVDIVTQTDEDVEAFIKSAINTRYPSHDFIGEETYAKSSQSTRPYLVTHTTPTWVVDPLDGTVNYTHLFPMFCVSIAFLVDGTPVIGVICAPMLGQLFTACKGRGAWLNETQRLPLVRQPMPKSAPGGCVFSCEWGKDRKDRPEGNLYRKVESFVNMAAEVGGRGGKGGMVHGVRSLGSATLDLAYTAMGSFDIWWEGGCWEWDVAAGIAILQEAGGLITSANPPEDWATAEIPDVKLGSRLYLVVRPAGPSEGETAREGQERTIREVWRRVRALDYTRPGA